MRPRNAQDLGCLLAGQLLVVWDHGDRFSARHRFDDLPQRLESGRRKLDVIPVRTDDYVRGLLLEQRVDLVAHRSEVVRVGRRRMDKSVCHGGVLDGSIVALPAMKRSS
jgi:hypothetical protein